MKFSSELSNAKETTKRLDWIIDYMAVRVKTSYNKSEGLNHSGHIGIKQARAQVVESINRTFVVDVIEEQALYQLREE